MENIQQTVPTPQLSQDLMIQEIYENTRKTKNYIKWQLYITVILVVLPLLASVIVIPFVLRSLASSYGPLLQ